MSRRRTLLGLLAVALLVSVLLWSTMASQRVECTVCVEFGAAANCATASAAGEVEAARSAQTTACGTLARGMAESISCANRPHRSRSCRSR